MSNPENLGPAFPRRLRASLVEYLVKAAIALAVGRIRALPPRLDFHHGVQLCAEAIVDRGKRAPVTSQISGCNRTFRERHRIKLGALQSLAIQDRTSLDLPGRQVVGTVSTTIL